MTPETLMRNIGDGQFHRPNTTTCMQLFTVDPYMLDALASEAEDLVRTNDPSKVDTETHVTNWTKPYGQALQFSLKNRSGRLDDFSGDHDNLTSGKRFHHAARYPHIADFVDNFPAATNFRLNVMGTQSGLSPHEEDVVFKNGQQIVFKTRFHLPVVTNSQAHMLLEEKLYHFSAGCVFWFNNGCVHAARNLGDTPRIHLVWDQWLTEATYHQMWAGSPFSRQPGWLHASHRTPSVVDSYPVDTYEVQDAPDGWRVTPEQFDERPHVLLEAA